MTHFKQVEPLRVKTIYVAFQDDVIAKSLCKYNCHICLFLHLDLWKNTLIYIYF